MPVDAQKMGFFAPLWVPNRNCRNAATHPLFKLRNMNELNIDPRAKALIFDLDGTLSNSLPVHIATWHTVCAGLNCTFNERIVEVMTGRPTIHFAERIKQDNQLEIEAEEIVRLKQEEFWKQMHRIAPITPVVELVKKYHGKLPLAVGTGAGRRSAMLQLETLGITNYFDIIVTADDVTSHKPEPETFLRCAELMQINPADCQVFEDGEMGMQAARKAGMLLTDVRPYLNN